MLGLVGRMILIMRFRIVGRAIAVVLTTMKLITVTIR